MDAKSMETTQARSAIDTKNGQRSSGGNTTTKSNTSKQKKYDEQEEEVVDLPTKTIDRITDKIGPDWQMIATDLGITQAAQGIIKQENSDNIKAQTREFLIKWRGRSVPEKRSKTMLEKFQELQKVLIELGRIDISDGITDRIKKKNEISDSILQYISEQSGDDWERILMQLGFDDLAIKMIEKREINHKMQMYLKRWRDGTKITLGAYTELKAVLNEHGYQEITEFLDKEIEDKKYEEQLTKVEDDVEIEDKKYEEQLTKVEDDVELRGNIPQVCQRNRESYLQRNQHVDKRNREIEQSTMELDQKLKSAKFIETRALRFAIKKIKIDSLKSPIMFLGLPGDGKTTHALRLIKELMNGHNFHKTKKQPLIIHGVSECKKIKLIDPDANLAVVIDDMYGKYSVPRQTEDTWEGCFPHLEACFSDTSSSSCNVMVVTMRKDIYEICKASLEDLPMFKSSVIIDLTSDDFSLTQEEKKDIFRTYFPSLYIKENEAQEIYEKNNQIGFPQCCEFYSKNKNLQVLKANFFKYPTRYLKQDFKKMLKGSKEERQRFCALVLIMLHGGCLKVDQCFEDDSSENDIQTMKNAALLCDLKYYQNLGNKLLKDAKSFVGVYVKCSDDGRQYRFSHDFVEQTVVNVMFEEDTRFMIKNSKFENFSQLCSDPLRGPSVFTMEKLHYKTIIERISNEVKDKQYRAFTTLANIDLWNEKEFREQFSESVRLEDVDDSTGDNMSLLECGAKTGNYHLVNYLCSLKPKTDILQKALNIAGCFGQEKVFFLLYEQDGIKANMQTFFYVIESANMNLFNLLLKSNINFNETCYVEFLCTQITAFQKICLTGNKEMAGEYLSHFPKLLESEDIDRSVSIAGFSGSKSFIEYLLELLKLRVDIRKTNVLLTASYSGSIDLVKYLILEKGLKCTHVDTEQKTMIHFACLSGNFELVKYIAENYPILLHMADKAGETNLHYACGKGSVDMIKYLIKKGMDVNNAAADRRTVLQSACLGNNLEVVKYLVQNYPDLLHKVDERGETNLHYACEGGSVEVVKYLIKKGVDVRQAATNKRTVLQSALLGKKLEVVKYLVENYHDLIEDGSGETNLHFACEWSSVEVVKYLIKEGLNVNVFASDLRTVLQSACFGNNIEVVKYLVENYPTLLHMIDSRGKTNLHYACEGGSEDVVKYLIKKGAAVSEFAAISTTVLHRACFSGKLEIVKYLVENYPDLLHKEDGRGETNLHYACEGGSVEVVVYLIKKGVDVMKVATNKRTVLHSACLQNKLEVVKYLVENYPELLQMEDKNGWTSFDYALGKHSVDVVVYLTPKQQS